MLRSSPSMARWKSGGALSLTMARESTSMITRWIIATTLSPGGGYFHAMRRGWPTRVSTRYMSPTWRSSCCWVAIFFESGDQRSTGRSLCTHPALSVA
jgi:hypothetical protein